MKQKGKTIKNLLKLNKTFQMCVKLVFLFLIIFTFSRKYHDLGLQLLNECFSEDQELTKNLLCSDRLDPTKKIPTLKIAAEIQNEEFVAHNSSQDLLDTKWNGYLDLNDDNKAKVRTFVSADHSRFFRLLPRLRQRSSLCQLFSILTH